MAEITRGSFTITIPDEIKTDVEYSKETILKEQYKLISKIKNNAEYLKYFLKDQYPEITSPSDIDQDLVYQAAWLEAYYYISDNIEDWVYIFVLGAAYNTVEFNHHLYISALQKNISKNINEIVKFKNRPSDKYIDIRVDFSSLGDVTLWGKAVKKVRELLKTKNEDPYLRSRFWREKIYGAGREGITITKEYKGKGKEKTGAGTKDITDRYSSKYFDTIVARLALCQGKAPFWYIIDKGNSNLGLPSDIGGEPYPLVAPTHFTKKLESFLYHQFHTALSKFEDKVRNWLSFKYKQWQKERKAIWKKEVAIENYKASLAAYDDGTKSYQEPGKEPVYFRSTSKAIGETEATRIPELAQTLETQKFISSRGKVYKQDRIRGPRGTWLPRNQ